MTRNALPERGRLTDTLLAYLKAHPAVVGFPLVVGDADPPPEAGWPGEPGRGAFVASVVVDTGQANPLHRDAIASRHTSWTCRYGLRIAGGLRNQADAGADVVRAAMLGFRVEVAGFKVQDIVYASLGAVTPKGSEGPTRTFEIADVVDVWLVRATT